VSGPGNNTPSHAAETTRVTLLVGLQQGDAEAWRRMVAIYSPFIYGMCRRWGLSPEDAGAELNLTANAVRVAKCKVLRRLREELGDHVGHLLRK
jgi:hypothetical protein